MRFGLPLKINLIGLLIVLILSATMGAFFLAEQQKTLQGALDRRVQIIGGGLSRNAESALARSDTEAIERILQSFSPDPEFSYIMVKSADGEILAARWARQTRGEVHEYAFPLHDVAERQRGDGHPHLFGAVQVVAPVFQRNVHTDQLRIPFAEPREALLDEGAPLRLHGDVLGLDLDVHGTARCN